MVGKKAREGPLGNCFDMICRTTNSVRELGEGGEPAPEGSADFGARKGRSEKGGSALSVRGRSAGTEYGHILRPAGFRFLCSASTEPVPRRGNLSRWHPCVWLAASQSWWSGNLQPFCQRGKAVPLSSGICQPAAALRNLDGEPVEEPTSWERKKARCGLPVLPPGGLWITASRDSMNMGAAMAPAARPDRGASERFFGRSRGYDAIITGDLGSVGREILLDLFGSGI